MLPSLAGVRLIENSKETLNQDMRYLLSRFATLFIAIALLLTSLLGYGVAPVLAAVGLTSFEVAPGSSNDELMVTWETETEVDTIAFQLKRATDQNPAAATLVTTVQAQGSSSSGASYEYPDGGLTSGTAYYYWLYEVSDTGDLVLLNFNGTPVSATPGQAGSTGTATATPTSQPATSTPTATARPATATPTATTAQTSSTQSATSTPLPTNTPVPSNTPASTSTPAPTNTRVAAVAATNPPAATDTPVLANTPANPDATAPATTPTSAVEAETQPAPVTVEGEATTPATDGERSETTGLEQVVPPSPTAEGDTPVPTGLTSVDAPTAQAVAEVGDTPAAAEQSAQPTVVRPTATPRPSRSGENSSTTGLLAVIGGGSLCAAALLALVAVFIWRRR